MGQVSAEVLGGEVAVFPLFRQKALVYTALGRGGGVGVGLAPAYVMPVCFDKIWRSKMFRPLLGDSPSSRMLCAGTRFAVSPSICEPFALFNAIILGVLVG